MDTRYSLAWNINSVKILRLWNRHLKSWRIQQTRCCVSHTYPNRSMYNCQDELWPLTKTCLVVCPCHQDRQKTKIFLNHRFILLCNWIWDLLPVWFRIMILYHLRNSEKNKTILIKIKEAFTKELTCNFSSGNLVENNSSILVKFGSIGRKSLLTLQTQRFGLSVRRKKVKKYFWDGMMWLNSWKIKNETKEFRISTVFVYEHSTEMSLGKVWITIRYLNNVTTYHRDWQIKVYMITNQFHVIVMAEPDYPLVGPLKLL